MGITHEDSPYNWALRQYIEGQQRQIDSLTRMVQHLKQKYQGATASFGCLQAQWQRQEQHNTDMRATVNNFAKIIDWFLENYSGLNEESIVKFKVVNMLEELENTTAANKQLRSIIHKQEQDLEKQGREISRLKFNQFPGVSQAWTNPTE